MMSKRSKQELTQEIHPRYLKANKIEKQRILDEFTAVTGYHRKYAFILSNFLLSWLSNCFSAYQATCTGYENLKSIFNSYIREQSKFHVPEIVVTLWVMRIVFIYFFMVQ